MWIKMTDDTIDGEKRAMLNTDYVSTITTQEEFTFPRENAWNVCAYYPDGTSVVLNNDNGYGLPFEIAQSLVDEIHWAMSRGKDALCIAERVERLRFNADMKLKEQERQQGDCAILGNLA